MAFRGLVNNSVELAFSIAGNLTKDIVFVNRGVSGYNFASQDTTATTTSTTTIKGIIEKQSRVRSGGSTYVTELKVLFRYSDVGVLDTYDYITVNDRNWRLENYDTDEYLVTAYFRAEE